MSRCQPGLHSGRRPEPATWLPARAGSWPREAEANLIIGIVIVSFGSGYPRVCLSCKLFLVESRPESATTRRPHPGQFTLVNQRFRGIAGGGARTHTILRSLDFESSASASSATPAAIKAVEKLQTPAESSSASDQVRIDSSQAERRCENLAQNDGFAQAGWRFE